MTKENTAITPACADLLDRVQQVKRLNKLTAVSIAKEAGMYRPTVQNQLNGRYNLDIRVVMAIARLSPNISCDWLLRGTGQMLPTQAPNQLESISQRLEAIEQQLHEISIANIQDSK